MTNWHARQIGHLLLNMITHQPDGGKSSISVDNVSRQMDRYGQPWQAYGSCYTPIQEYLHLQICDDVVGRVKT